MLPVSAELYCYWRALQAKRSPPERDDVEPGAIRGILADTFMLDFDEEGGFPLRISGSKTNSFFMCELRGQPFLDMWRENDRGAVRSALRRAADESGPYLLHAEARPSDACAIRVEILLLPLRHRGSPHSRVLGSIALESPPEWLGLTGSGPIALLSVEPVVAPQVEAAPKIARFRLPFGGPALRVG